MGRVRTLQILQLLDCTDPELSSSSTESGVCDDPLAY